MAANKDIIEFLKTGLSAEMRNFYKNQQLFIHSYLLDKGYSITKSLIEGIIKEFGREISPGTYYGLRKRLFKHDWVEDDPEVTSFNVKGPTETSHNIKDKKKEEFHRIMIHNDGVISRPFKLNKYHLLEMSRFSDFDSEEDIEKMKEYLQNKDIDTFVVPGFFFKQTVENLLKLKQNETKAHSDSGRVADGYDDPKYQYAAQPLSSNNIGEATYNDGEVRGDVFFTKLEGRDETWILSGYFTHRIKILLSDGITTIDGKTTIEVNSTDDDEFPFEFKEEIADRCDWGKIKVIKED